MASAAPLLLDNSDAASSDRGTTLSEASRLLSSRAALSNGSACVTLDASDKQTTSVASDDSCPARMMLMFKWDFRAGIGYKVCKALMSIS